MGAGGPRGAGEQGWVPLSAHGQRGGRESPPGVRAGSGHGGGTSARAAQEPGRDGRGGGQSAWSRPRRGHRGLAAPRARRSEGPAASSPAGVSCRRNLLSSPGQSRSQRHFRLLPPGRAGTGGRRQNAVREREEEPRGAPSLGDGGAGPGDPGHGARGCLSSGALPAAPSRVGTSPGDAAPASVQGSRWPRRALSTWFWTLRPTPSPPPHRIPSPPAWWPLFLLQTLHFQDQGFVSFPVSEPLDQLSCVTAGRPPNPRRRTLRTVVRRGPRGSKVRGLENSEVPSRNGPGFRSGCISGVTKGTVFACSANKQDAELLYSKGLFI